MKQDTVIAVDFDGTLVIHSYPKMGAEVPYAFEFLREFQNRGVKLILWTIRSCDGEHGDKLQEAIDFCAARGVTFWGINSNPGQAEWSSSRKCYAHMYIDDAAVGTPLVRHGRHRPYVDWLKVGPHVIKVLEGMTRFPKDIVRQTEELPAVCP